MMTKSTPQGDTRIRITLSKEQYEQAQKIAQRSNLSIDELIQRYICRCIADLHHP
jgi:RNase P subunit RPR2